MTKRKKIAYTLADGKTITGGVTTIDRKVEDALQMRAYGGSSVRMGDHSVFVGYFDVAVSIDAHVTPHIEPVWKCAEMRDTRIGQIATVQSAMKRVPHHPCYDEIMRVTNNELTKWDAHGETPKYPRG